MCILYQFTSKTGLTTLELIPKKVSIKFPKPLRPRDGVAYRVVGIGARKVLTEIADKAGRKVREKAWKDAKDRKKEVNISSSSWSRAFQEGHTIFTCAETHYRR